MTRRVLDKALKITAPQSSNLLLDTRYHMFATHPNGKPVVDETTGKPVQIAQDLHSGLWFAKAAESMPFRQGVKALQPLIDAGAVHVPHDDERFRGVWIPLDAYEEQREGKGEPIDLLGAGADTSLATVPAKKTAAKKTAAKKTAAKKTVVPKTEAETANAR